MRMNINGWQAAMAAAWLTVCGCAPLQKDARAYRESRPAESTPARLDAAREAFAVAVDGPALRRSMDLWQKVLEADPGNYEAHALLANQYILLGTAFTEGRRAKARHFREALRHSITAMHRNAAFRQRVAAGEAVSEAVGSLGPEEWEAMLFWVTALQYQFKECQSTVQHVLRIGQLRQALRVVERLQALRPGAPGGHAEFAKSICLFALPRGMGGSREGARAAVETAVQENPDWLFPRWSRAKYYQVITKNPAGQRADFEWVAAQDPTKFRDVPAWAAHFQAEARAWLKVGR